MASNKPGQERMKQIFRLALVMIFVWQPLRPQTLFGAEKLDPSLIQIEKRLEEETMVRPSEPNSLTYRRAIGELPVRAVQPREMKAKRMLTLDECLQLAFVNNNATNLMYLT